MRNSFAAVANGSNRFTRKWSGTQGATVDPYITGYHFIYFSYIPKTLERMLNQTTLPGGIDTIAKVKNFLHSSCLSVTLPGGMVNRAEFNGLGNIRYSAPSNVDFDNTVSMRFLEFSGTPTLAIFHGWVRMIRDYRSGASPLDDTYDTYTRSNYAATMFYWTTQPNGKFIEEYECITGMFPLKDPRDLYGHDLTVYDKLEIDIDFNSDTLWHEDWVRDRCQTYAEDYYGDWGGTGSNSPLNQFGIDDANDN